MKGKKWTPEEDAQILALVKDNAVNLKTAFETAAIQLDRTPSACTVRWYTVISKNPNKDSIAFMCISNKSCGVNRKNCKTNTGMEESFISKIWSKIFNMFK